MFRLKADDGAAECLLPAQKHFLFPPRADPLSRKRPKLVALIPARSGSRRIRGKNIRPLGGHPLIAHTILPALRSGIFDAVVCSTDSRTYGRIASRYGAEVILRPKALSGHQSPDIAWVRHALATLAGKGRHYDIFSILRPTSPFRTPQTLRRAWRVFQSKPFADSLRAVQPCRQHPAKMWKLVGKHIRPLGSWGKRKGMPSHSVPYSALPRVLAQDASLEIAWTEVPLRQKTIAGKKVKPFFSRGWEGLDLNEPEDWWVAERLLQEGRVKIPPRSLYLRQKPFRKTRL